MGGDTLRIGFELCSKLTHNDRVIHLMMFLRDFRNV